MSVTNPTQLSVTDPTAAPIHRWSSWIIVSGIALIFLQAGFEFVLQFMIVRRAIKTGYPYTFTPIGAIYIGLLVVVIGAALMVFAPLIARRARQSGECACDRPSKR
jgi:TRAP-type C4-dicarboxylate transport system permease small subunit